MNRTFKKTELAKVAKWWKHSNTGMSSKAILMNVIADVKLDDYPYDPSDFKRCVDMMIELPFVRTYFKRCMVNRGKVWKRYVKHWDELMIIYDEEVTDGSGVAMRLFKRMKELQGYAL